MTAIRQPADEALLPATGAAGVFAALAALVASAFDGGMLQHAAALAACGCDCASAALAPREGGPVAVYPTLLAGPRAQLLDLAPIVAASGAASGMLSDGAFWAGAPVLSGGRTLGALLVAQPSAGPIDTVLLGAVAVFVAPLLERALGARRGGPAGIDAEVLLDSLSDPAALIGEEGVVIAANRPLRLLLQDAGISDFAPVSTARLHARERSGRAVKADDRIYPRVVNGRSVRAERIFRMADGRDRAFAITASPLIGASGLVDAGVLVLREISEAIARERALRLMHEVRRGLSLSEDLRGAAKSVCRRAVSLLDWVNMAAIATLEGEAAGFIAQSGFPARAARLLTTLPLGPAGPLFRAEDGRSAVFQAHVEEPGSDAARQIVAAAGAATFVNLPLDAGARRFGVLTLVSRTPHRPSRDELAVLEALALQVGAELEGLRRREQAEAERARLQAVVDQLPEGVLLFDAAGRLTMSNRSAVEILGDAVGAGVPMQGLPHRLGLLRADGRAYHFGDDPLARTFSTGRPVLGEEALMRRGNAETPLVLNVAPVRDNGGELAAVIMIFQDITALREMDRQKDEFLSIAGHELRTPLTGIQGYAQFLSRRFDRLGREQALDALRAIEEQTAAMAALIDELLDVSRIRNGGLTLEIARCDLAPLARAAVERLQAQRPGAVSLSGNESVVVLGDARRLTQVLGNLLDNAAKYSGPDAPIAVRLEAVGGTARVRVQDRGIGIPPSGVERLFERFYRAENAAAQAGGLGLGLYLCQEIIERHGGGIDVRSALNEGTEFVVRLPLPNEKDGRHG